MHDRWSDDGAHLWHSQSPHSVDGLRGLLLAKSWDRDAPVRLFPDEDFIVFLIALLLIFAS